MNLERKIYCFDVGHDDRRNSYGYMVFADEITLINHPIFDVILPFTFLMDRVLISGKLMPQFGHEKYL